MIFDICSASIEVADRSNQFISRLLREPFSQSVCVPLKGLGFDAHSMGNIIYN